MSWATLKFNLEEESEAFDDAVNGSKLRCILTDLDNEMRGYIKYDNTAPFEEWCQANEGSTLSLDSLTLYWRHRLTSLLNDYNLNR